MISQETNDLVLKGETYRHFINGIKSPATQEGYKRSFRRYLTFLKLREVNDLLPHNPSPRYIESHIISYIMSLRESGVAYATIQFLVAPIFTFYQLNDVVLNRKKVSRYLGEYRRVAKDGAYTIEQIQTALQNADARMRMIILLLSCTAARIGASLTLGDLTRIPEYGLYKVIFYESSNNEYYTFTTRETAQTGIDNYLLYRKRMGENISFNEKTQQWEPSDVPLIRKQFDVNSFKLKHLWVKKATGLGITEFMLRFMAWLCLYDDGYRNSQMVIVTGPNQELAIKLIKRMKGLFANLGVTFDSKETVLELNGCTIEAYPSNHIDAFRSLTNPKFILIDEGDFFRKNEQEDVRHVAERYIAKSNPFIVMVSTPNAPGGLFERIEKESFESCIYKKIFLDYTYGLGKIYTQEEIEKARRSPSFEREYCLKYQGLIGNVFSTQSIDNALKVRYNPLNIEPNAKKSLGIDPGFGSSEFAIVATQLVDGKIQVIEAEQYERPDFTDMISEVWKLRQRCGGHINNIYVDAANPVVWQSLKKEFGEPFDEKTIREKKAYALKYNLHIEDQMLVVPVPFAIEGAKMLQHTKWLLDEKDEDGSSLLAIDRERFHKLVTALRTAVANEYKLDKEQTSYNDILDAFRLALQFYKRSKA